MCACKSKVIWKWRTTPTLWSQQEPLTASCLLMKYFIYIRTVYSGVYKYSHILKFIPTVVGCLCAVLPSNGFMRQKPIYSPILFLPQITPHPTDHLPTQVAWWSPKRGSRYESNVSRTSPPSLTTLNLKTGGPSRLRRKISKVKLI